MEEKCEQSFNSIMSLEYETETVHRILKNGTKEEILDIMLQRKIDLHCVGENGDTVLHAIFRNKKLTETDITEISTIFLIRGVNPNIENSREETVLHLSIERRMKNAVTLLLKFKADIHIANNRGNSLAHFFVEDERKKCNSMVRDPLRNTEENREKMANDTVTFLQFLMFKEVDFDHRNVLGQSALHLAVAYYLPHLLRTLLDYTKDIMFTDKTEKTLLQLFLEARSRSLSRVLDEYPRFDHNPRYAAKCLRILLDRGAPVLAVGKFRHILNMKAFDERRNWNIIEIIMNSNLNDCYDKNFSAILLQELIGTVNSSKEAEYFFKVLHDLLTLSVNVNNERARKNQVESLVLAAIEAKHVGLLAFLQEYNGGDFNFRLSYGETPMHLLAREHNYDRYDSEFYGIFCDFLVRGGCTANATNDRGESALHKAAFYGNVLMARKLIELGAEVNRRDERMRTPLHSAVETGRHVESAKLLLMSGADVNAKNCDGVTPLHVAASHERVEIARLLLQHGASVDCKNKFQQTPLHLAGYKDNAATMVELLLASGADLNAKGYKGKSPLHLAVDYSQVSVVELLIANGADVNAKDDEGNGPLHKAIRRPTADSGRILKMLLEKGAYVNARNNKGESALFKALLYSYGVTVGELLKYNANMNDPKVRESMRRCHYNTNRKIFQRHWLKWAAADLPLDEECRGFVNKYGDQEYYSKCLKEIEKLKNTSIGDFESVYDFLHMRPERGRVYANCENMKQLVELARLNEQFPEYGVLILASYYRAKIVEAREKVSAVMAEIFLELYKVSVDQIVEKIVNYLQDEDLRVSVPFQ